MSERSSAWRAAQEQAGAEAQLADELPRDEEVALRRSERVLGVAELSILPFIGKVQDAFYVAVGRHSE